MFSRRLIPLIATFLPVRTTNSLIHRSRNTWLIRGHLKYNLYCSSAESQIDTKTRLCWKCKALITSAIEFFCPSCNIIQRPSKKETFFELMASPMTFDVDTAQLSEKYKELQWKLHPDKFSDVSEKAIMQNWSRNKMKSGQLLEEKQLSEEQSSRVNEAYNTLLKPLSRGLYLLNLNGEQIKEGEATSTDGEFLAVIMEQYEQIATSSDEKVKAIQKENNASLEKCIKDISNAFAKGDISKARQEVIKLNYYTSVAEYIRNHEGWN